MEKSVEFKPWQRVLIIIMGGFVLGGMWRIRGDAGFGSFWGMLAVSLTYCLFLFSVIPSRKKMNYFLLPWLVVSMPLTVNGWGTLNLQPAGIINAALDGSTNIIHYNPVSGVFIMLCLGFCWFPFFAFLMGRYYSERQYRIRDFLLIIVSFYAVKYLFMATLAHPILQLTCGDANRLFMKGLAEIHATGSPWKMYLQHFDDAKWAKSVIGGRNYFTSINIIASVAGTFAIMGSTLFLLKDKLTAKITFLICSALAVSILAADVFNILGSGGYHLNTFNPPEWLKNNAWGYWEYFTGFFAGLLITTILVIQSRKSGNKGADIPDKLPQTIKNKWLGYFYYLFIFCSAMLCSEIVRATQGRLVDHGLFREEGISGSIVFPVLVVPAFILFAIVLYRNIIKKGIGQPFNADFKTFSLTASPIVFAIFVFIDLCIGYTCWDEPARFGINFLVGLSLVVALIGYVILRKDLKTHIQKQ